MWSVRSPETSEPTNYEAHFTFDRLPATTGKARQWHRAGPGATGEAATGFRAAVRLCRAVETGASIRRSHKHAQPKLEDRKADIAGGWIPGCRVA